MKELKYLVYYSIEKDEYIRSGAMNDNGLENFMSLSNIKPITVTTNKELATSITHNCNVNLTRRYLTPYEL